MRMPTTEPNGPIDEQKSMELIEHAYKSGVNYFDTAFFYHSGKSENFIGKALAKYPRDTWYLADKMPGNFMSIENGKLKMKLGAMGMDDMAFDSPADVFEFQLEKCGVDYFDFFLLHNFCEDTYDLYTDKKIGIIDYLLEQKKAGRIRHFGFSTHAGPEEIEKILSRYKCFEFVQMQLNYLDWTLQEAGKVYEILTKYNVPVIVMEGVRGDKLANPGEKATAMLKGKRPNDSPAAWAFRFLQSLPNVALVLSGMTTMEQLKENLQIFSHEDPVTDAEKQLLQEVVDSMADFLPCTSCKYCMGSCPQKLDIPMLMYTCNEAMYDFSWIVRSTIAALPDEEKPSACIACGACSPLCPQNIDIPGAIAKLTDLLAKHSEPE